MVGEFLKSCQQQKSLFFGFTTVTAGKKSYHYYLEFSSSEGYYTELCKCHLFSLSQYFFFLAFLFYHFKPFLFVFIPFYFHSTPQPPSTGTDLCSSQATVVVSTFFHSVCVCALSYRDSELAEKKECRCCNCFHFVPVPPLP